MRIKKILCALLAVLMILPIAACGNTGEDVTATEASSTAADAAAETDASEAETAKATLDLPEKKFEDYELTFITRDEGEWTTVEIVPDEDSEFVNIAEAVSERNEILKSVYGITLNQIATNNANYTTVVSKETMSPSGDFQAIISRLDTAANLVQQGSLVNLLNETCSTYMDFTKPWWDSQVTEELAIDGKAYFATGDLLTADNDATFCLLFNKKIASEAQLPDLYQQVNNGTWTMDQMYSYEGLVINDKDGDGKLSYDSDVCGFAYTGDSPYCILYAGGLRVIQRDNDGELSYNLDISRASDIQDKAALLFSSSLTVDMNAPGGSVVEVGQKCFGENHALFFGECMQCVARMRSYDVDFGVLPFPKYDEAQEQYYSMMHLAGSVVSIPKSVEGDSLSTVAYLLEAISYYSVDTVTNLYYDLNLKTKNAKDAESGPMIDLILDNRVYDVAYAYSLQGVVGNLASAMLPSSNKNVASMEKSSKTSVNTGLRKLRKNIEKAEKKSS
jgi:predicted small lipoprotein YifL